MSSHALRCFVSLIVLVTLILQPISASATLPIAETQRDAAAPTGPQETGFLFRALVQLDGSRNLARLEKTGVVLLRSFEEGKQQALVLADAEQLADLARLGFRPQAADELRSLLQAQGKEKRWLADSLAPLLAQADALTAQADVASLKEGTVAVDAAGLEALRTSMQALSLETLAGTADSVSVDDDADGLTNTQEAWWCTDPGDPDTDDDGRTDGAEISALKDWLGNRRESAPGETPWPNWPPQRTNCVDKDNDSIPNLAERWELGLNMDRESTDRDKFDDGQELFGVTHCPGGDNSCGYGDLPRSSDAGYVGAQMPSWVKAPGKHPVVAAFPGPEVDIVESSLKVQTVTEVTTDHVVASGTEKSYTTAKTEGVGKSETDTTNWNDWEESSITQPASAARSVAPDGFLPPGYAGQTCPGFGPMYALDKICYLTLTALNFGYDLCSDGRGQLSAAQCKRGAGAKVQPLVSAGQAADNAVKAVGTRIVDNLRFVGKQTLSLAGKAADWVQQNVKVNSCNVGFPSGVSCEVGLKERGYDSSAGYFDRQGYSGAESDPVGGIQANRLSVAGDSGQMANYYPIEYPLSQVGPTVTESKGRSWGGSHSVTNTTYEENTITNGEAFSSEESWGTATAVDSTHAADLWFSYTVRNTGTEYAREIGDLAFNIYVGDDANPVYTYFVAPDLGGDGKFHNFMPGEAHTYSARTNTHAVPLTLDQMREVDLGGPVRIVVEDLTYGADELFYQDAVNAGVMVAMEDGTADGDESIDNYVLPTWGTEKVLDVLARYFPHTTDANDNLTAIWTPEYRSDTPAWCDAPSRTGNTLWCRHALSTADWWNVYTNGMGDGTEGFQDTPANPGQIALFRFNQDSDLDGYSDRSEGRLGTNPNDPASFPRPELLAGVHSIQNGNLVTATLSLLNTGVYDAYGVEAVMIAPDDTVNITNNTVGGSGRVRAQKQVIVGSRILPQDPLPAAWAQTGHAKPAAGGYYTGSADRVYTFTVQNCAAGGCQVGAGGWVLHWDDGKGASGDLSFAAGYASPNFLAVGTLGVKLALYTGTVNNGESFTVAANTPRDTFQYTIAGGHEADYTPPIVLVSYNDPQGNHRFVTPVNLTSPIDDLSVHSGKMREGGAGVEIVTHAAFDPSGPNTTDLVLTVPAAMQDAHAFLEFVDPNGAVVREETVTQDLVAGPNIVPVTWDPANFNPAFDSNQDYIVMAFFTDWQGNILDTAARPLSSFQADPKPVVALDEAGATWNFGTVAEGDILEHVFTVGNIGQMVLRAAVSGTGARADQTIPGQPSWVDTGLDVVAGDALGIRSSGLVCYGDGGTVCYGPDGSGSPADSSFTLPGASAYSLIGRIGAAPAFAVSATYVSTTSTAGRLYLGTNDITTGYANNLGGYEAHIEVQGLPNSQSTRFGFAVGAADTAAITVTLDTYYLPAGAFDRSLTLRTSDPDRPSQVLRVQGTVQPYVAPARSTAVSPYQPWDEKAVVAGDLAARALVTYADEISADPASVQPLWVHDDAGAMRLGSGKEVATATASGMDVEGSGVASRSEPEVAEEELRVGAGGDASVAPSALTALPWWNSGFRYRRQLFISGWLSMGNTIKVNAVNFNDLQTAGKIRGDKYDLRVVRYLSGAWQEVARNYISEWDLDFKLLSDIGGSTDSSYWLYYGNPSASAPPTFPGPSQGWWADMYHDKDWSDYGGTWSFNQAMDFNSVCDPPLDHDGRIGSSFDESDKFRGRLYIPSSGTWTFRVHTNDGYRLYLDDWDVGHFDGYDGARTVLIGSIYLKAGWYKMDLRKRWVNCGPWKFYMEGPGFGNQIVPAHYFNFLWENVATVSVGDEVAQYGTVRGVVFGDHNNNGTQDAGELGLAGVTVTLSGVGTTQTNSSGSYTFVEVSPNSYTVAVTPPNGYVTTTPGSVAITLEPGGTVTTNFGLLPRGSVSGKVFHDTNNNLAQDTGELGIAGVTVKLNGGEQTRTTASDGSYSFADLMPATYTVAVTVPDGYVNTTDTQKSVSVSAGTNATVNFGLLIYTVEKVSGSDHDNRLFVPETFKGGRRYWVQYGRSLSYTASGSVRAQVEVPQLHYGAAALDLFVTAPIGGNVFVQVSLDVGCDSSQEWSVNGNYTLPQTFSTDALALGFNRYLSTLATDPDGLVSVPLCVNYNQAGRIYLTNLRLTPDGISDLSISPADISFGAADPVEGDSVPIEAVLRNPSARSSGALMASFYATNPTWGEWYIGSAFVPDVPAGGTAPAQIVWNTLGFTGTVPIRVSIDPYNRIAETNEDNNEASTTKGIKTRPDLRVAQIALSDDEPMAGESITATLTLHNAGQTPAADSRVALYDGNPDAGGSLLSESTLPVGAGADAAIDVTWKPTAAGPHQLFARVDTEKVVSEYDEGNNDTWREVYAGFASPLLIDSGGGTDFDPGYTSELGFGALGGEINTFCGSDVTSSQRSDADGAVQYRFDHLLPGHFYHLDLTLVECDGVGRGEQVRVDDNLISQVIDLSDGTVKRRSFRLDPAFYADRSIIVSIEELYGSDAVVSEINLYDIDYRYSDAGASAEPAYSAARGYGWLDGVAQSPWGTLPYQTRRNDLGDSNTGDDPDNELRYRFDRLDRNKKYQLLLTVYQGAGTVTVRQNVAVDSVDTGTVLEVVGVDQDEKIVDVPPGMYTTDGTITVRITRQNATAQAFVSEIALEELTLTPPGCQDVPVKQVIPLHTGGPNWFSFNIKPPVQPPAACSGVSATSLFTTLYGQSLLAGASASVGFMVEAFTPGGVKTGCFKVTEAGLYGYMRVYGAEGATAGMQPGDPILLKINGIAAATTPYPLVWQDDKATHEVRLDAPDVVPVETLLGPIAGKYTKLQCENGTYLPPPADPRFNTCTTVAAGASYLLWMNTAANLTVSGCPVAQDKPVTLHAGYNWLGYLPTCELAVATALQTIQGKYDIVHSEAGTYKPPPADPKYNNFSTLAPGRGYMIHMTEAGTLTYPAEVCGSAMKTEVPPEAVVGSCSAQPTSRFTHYYGQVDAPVGTQILARSPVGDVVGCGIVNAEGLVPYVRVYGGEDGQDGLKPGEQVTLVTAEGKVVASATWQNDWDVHLLGTRDMKARMYLPGVWR